MIFLKSFKLFFLILLSFPIVLTAQKKPVLSNPNSSKEAVALYSYINDMFGKKILSGQMCSTWGVDELKYIYEVTGKYPAIRGMDFIETAQNDSEVLRAIDWWKRGGIPTIMWHWGAPGIGEGYKNSLKQIDINKCFEKGTPENIAFWNELKKKADQLEKLKNANVPILWRPFHEFTGDWFWWSKQGPEQFKRLWKTMYQYFVNDRKLNNLIWVLCYTAKPDSAWYPGDKYVDIAGADNYKIGDDPGTEMYNAVKKIVDNRVPIAYHECGVPPNPEKCFEQGIMWSWFMEWHTDFIMKVDKEYLKHVYNNDLVVTLDEVPDIMKVYGKNQRGK
jgi:hypothetical protein